MTGNTAKSVLISYAFTLLCIGVIVVSNGSDINLWLIKHGLLDKAGHFIGFLLLSAIVDRVVKLNLTVTITALIIYSGLTELCQWVLGFRNAEFLDFVADAAGCFSYYIVIKIITWLRNANA
ncbi:VanZ family protein [Thalassotalea maritima]|uniref:VanZ family protein n=1 Tax=Thalassotalea maritima TaxID=3242416 RepID=UPI003527040A